MNRALNSVLSFVTLAVATTALAAAAPPTPPPHPGPAPAPATGAAGSQTPEKGPSAYDRFIKDAVKEPGLFTIYRKDGHVFLELGANQFDTDYLEHIVPANGLGGFGFESGQMFVQSARLVQFHNIDDKAVAMIWPATRFTADPNTALARAVRMSTADSVQVVLPVVASDDVNRKVVVDLAPLLGDSLDLGSALSDAVDNPLNPFGSYRLDPTRTYFGPSKSFPKNAVIEADETFASSKPDAIDTVTDARSIQMRVIYNLTAILSSPDYMPRLYDDRVGFWEDPHVEFGNDSQRDNYLWYILRWNIQPSDPSKPLSPAKKPIVFTLDNSIPPEYRAPVRAGIMQWNNAFEKIGVTDAIQVQDQPTDGTYDPDDIRFNVIRWVTDAVPDFGAEAQIVWDPRTGEIFRGGVLLDSGIVRRAKFGFKNLIAPDASADEITPIVPRKGPYLPMHDEAAYGAGMHAEFNYGATALELMYGSSANIDGFSRDLLEAVTLHEVGHDFGLSHNFIGHYAFTASELQSSSFTAKHGVASSVMEYAPVNLWPKGTPQGHFWQTTLGSYDYHAIHWGYAPVPSAHSPQGEVQTLSRWASNSTDPRYMFAGDEDAFYDGHAIDPRVAQFMLTDRPIQWCATQLKLTRSLFSTIDGRFPSHQQPWDDERVAFMSLLNRYATCATAMTHYIAGEYLSRARVGDPRAPTPLSAVPRNQEQLAYNMLTTYLFSDSAWHFSPGTLNRLVYTEYMPFSNFGYDPSARHDVPVVEVAARLQNGALNYMFSPLVLQRLADLPTKYPAGKTMSLTDLFVWTQNAIFSDVADGKPGGTQVHRNLQRRYSRTLARMITTPLPGTPYDAEALAHHELLVLSGQLRRNLANPKLDLQTRSNLEAIQVDVTRALDARQVVE